MFSSRHQFIAIASIKQYERFAQRHWILCGDISKLKKGLLKIKNLEIKSIAIRNLLQDEISCDNINRAIKSLVKDSLFTGNEKKTIVIYLSVRDNEDSNNKQTI
mgnify:CR=1 FL=1